MPLILNNEFLKAYNSLDTILKDMYRKSESGITSYINEMETYKFKGTSLVDGWRRDFEKLKDLRHKRNTAIHESQLEFDVFSQEDIDWVNNFKSRVISRTDPLAQLNSKMAPQLKPNSVKTQRPTVANTSNSRSAGCLTIAALMLAIPILIVAIIFIL